MNDGIDEERCDEQVRQLGRGVLLGRDLPHHVLRRQVLEEGIQECRMDPCLLGQDGGTGWGILILQQGLEDLVVLGNSRRDERERLHGTRQRLGRFPSQSFSLTYGVDQSLERLEGLLQRDGGLAGQRDDLLSVGREGLGVGDQSAQLVEQDGGLGFDLPVGHGGMSITG